MYLVVSSLHGVQSCLNLIAQLVKKFSTFYVCRSFITVLPRVHLKSLSCDTQIPLHLVCKYHFTIILPQLLALHLGVFLSGSRLKLYIHLFSSFRRATYLAKRIRLDLITLMIFGKEHRL